MKIMAAIILSIAALLFYLLWFFQGRMIFFPEKIPADYRFQFPGLVFEEKYFQRSDAVIHTLLFRKKNPQGLVIYFHGNAGSLKSWGSIAYDWQKYNLDLLVVDYRGYGKSSGELTEKNLYLDSEAIYDSIAQGYNRKIIYGRSIGSGIATWLAAKREVDGLLLESPLYNMEYLAQLHYPWFPVSMLRFHFRNDKRMKKLRCPVFVIHGDNDQVIPLDSSLMLSRESLTNMKLTVVRGGGHNDLSSFADYPMWLDHSLQNLL